MIPALTDARAGFTDTSAVTHVSQQERRKLHVRLSCDKQPHSGQHVAGVFRDCISWFGQNVQLKASRVQDTRRKSDPLVGVNINALSLDEGWKAVSALICVFYLMDVYQVRVGDIFAFRTLTFDRKRNVAPKHQHERVIILRKYKQPEQPGEGARKLDYLF